MSFTIKPPEIDDPELVRGYPVHAKIETSIGSLIYLTEEDFNDLYASIQEYVTTTFCKDCVHSRVSSSGLSYGLSCNLECLQEFHVPEIHQTMDTIIVIMHMILVNMLQLQRRRSCGSM